MEFPKSKSFGIIIVSVILMLIATFFLQLGYNQREVHITKMQGRQADAAIMAQVYLALDKLEADNFYKKVWTFNAIILAAGISLAVFAKEEDRKRK